MRLDVGIIVHATRLRVVQHWSANEGVDGWMDVILLNSHAFLPTLG